MRTVIDGTFGGTFKAGKGYDDIDYHVKEIAKVLEGFNFTVTVKTVSEPKPALKRKVVNVQEGA